MRQLECSWKLSQMWNEKWLWIVKNRTTNTIWRNKFYYMYAFEFRESESRKCILTMRIRITRKYTSAILWHVETSINNLEIIKHYLCRSSFLTKLIKRRDSFKAKFCTNHFPSRCEPPRICRNTFQNTY